MIKIQGIKIEKIKGQENKYSKNKNQNTIWKLKRTKIQEKRNTENKNTRKRNKNPKNKNMKNLKCGKMLSSLCKNKNYTKNVKTQKRRWIIIIVKNRKYQRETNFYPRNHKHFFLNFISCLQNKRKKKVRRWKN